MGSRVIGFILYLAACLFCGLNLLYPTGMVGVTKKPGSLQFGTTGCFCHNDKDSASARTRVWISGPETLRAGLQALYTISVAKESSHAAGFDLSAVFGDLGVTDSNAMYLQAPNDSSSPELTHAEPRFADGHDTISWSFYYGAPLTVGVVYTLYACGNSVDLNGSPDGDYWNYAPNFRVRVVGSTDIPEHQIVQSFRLAQNYPNPFNPSTVIQFEMPVAGHVSLAVFDMTGKKVGEILNENMGQGAHEARFTADGETTLSSGVYFYQLIVQPFASVDAGPFVLAKKMLLLR